MTRVALGLFLGLGLAACSGNVVSPPGRDGGSAAADAGGSSDAGRSSDAGGSADASSAPDASQPVRHTVPNDFDGDGKSDLVLYCPATDSGLWYVAFSGGGTNAGAPFQLGTHDSIPVTGDYDGDGKADFAVYTPRVAGDKSEWQIHSSKTDATTSKSWGFAGTLAAPADFDGDGKTDLAVYFPGAGQWFVISSRTGQDNAANPGQFGYLGTHPAVADYDGDGTADDALFDAKAGVKWFVLSSSDGQSVYPSGTDFGLAGDVPVPADYDGDGKADLAFFRPSDGTWHIRPSSGGAEFSIQFGAPTDWPVPGDYDGDGKSDLALYRRPRGGAPALWFVRTVSGTTLHDAVQWGFGVCRPVGLVEQDPEGFVLVPAGSFQMGNSPGDPFNSVSSFWGFDVEKPHAVTLSRDFWMKATEVTQAEWLSVTGSNPSVFTGCGGDCPVDGVSWKQTLAYCNALLAKEGLTPCYFRDAAGTVPYDFAASGDNSIVPTWPLGLGCQGYRLPTEAEWEFSARAGTTTPLFSGAANGTNLDPIGWHSGNSGCSYEGCDATNYCAGVSMAASGPRPAAGKRPNDLGLYDTAGNLWEFVWDFFGEYPDGPVTDPTGPAKTNGFHVARGGSWLNGPSDARVSRRDGDDNTCDQDNGPGPHTGFRLARSKP